MPKANATTTAYYALKRTGVGNSNLFFAGFRYIGAGKVEPQWTGTSSSGAAARPDLTARMFTPILFREKEGQEIKDTLQDLKALHLGVAVMDVFFVG